MVLDVVVVVVLLVVVVGRVVWGQVMFRRRGGGPDGPTGGPEGGEGSLRGEWGNTCEQPDIPVYRSLMCLPALLPCFLQELHPFRKLKVRHVFRKKSMGSTLGRGT